MTESEFYLLPIARLALPPRTKQFCGINAFRSIGDLFNNLDILHKYHGGGPAKSKDATKAILSLRQQFLDSGELVIEGSPKRELEKRLATLTKLASRLAIDLEKLHADLLKI